LDNNTVFQNEFAMVEVRRDDTANGVRLLIRDMATGHGVYLDPLELEGIARAPGGLFRSLITPKAQEYTQLEEIPLDSMR
jgi:hypothetical protein